MRELESLLDRDALVTTDAGNFAGWATRFINFRDGQRYIGPTNGAMGYSVPAAIGAKIAYPDRMVVSLVGDGGFLMTGQELATAFHHGVAPIVLVFNNQMYGTIRMHQERAYPGRVSGTGADQSRLRQIHRGVRRAWRSGERHRRVLAGVPPRGGQRQAGGDRTAHEPRADHHARHHRGPACRQGGEARGESRSVPPRRSSRSRRAARNPARSEVDEFRIRHRFSVDASGRPVQPSHSWRLRQRRAPAMRALLAERNEAVWP